jgi:hypothetical protein
MNETWTLDEKAERKRRLLRIAAGGRVIGVRKSDIPSGAPLAAIPRYPV